MQHFTAVSEKRQRESDTNRMTEKAGRPREAGPEMVLSLNAFEFGALGILLSALGGAKES